MITSRHPSSIGERFCAGLEGDLLRREFLAEATARRRMSSETCAHVLTLSDAELRTVVRATFGR